MYEDALGEAYRAQLGFLPPQQQPSSQSQNQQTSQDQSLNQPQQQPTSAPSDVAKNLEPDTCRICRSEGTAREPLFYPCKCSGSIKYVHQDCLMEWLSHSQKKHCELCKTSFRFTKLYSPNMPKQLPVFVFAQHLAKYFLRNILVWLRVLLVFFVWMVLLPALTRWEWSFFFWVSEEGLVAAPPSPRELGSGSSSSSSSSSSLGGGNATTSLFGPASLLSSAMVGVASSLVNGTMTAVSNSTSTVTETVTVTEQAEIYNSIFDGNYTMPVSLLTIGFRVIKEIFGASEITAMFSVDNGTEGDYYANTGPQTLLSDVTFLRKLTRFRQLNRWVIYALEGQFITFLVIVCFILIILVRDYVLQQQPEINMRAAFNAADEDGMGPGGEVDAAGVPGVPGVGQAQAAPRPPRAQGHRHHHHHHHQGHQHGQGHQQDHDHDHDHQHMRGDPDDPGYDTWESDSEWETDSNEVEIDPDDLMRPLMHGAGRDGLQFQPIFGDDFERGPPVPDTPSPPAERDEPGESSSSAAAAPASASASASAPAAAANTAAPVAALPNFDRNFPLPREGGATVHEYMNIYRRAGGDQQRIVEIARAEGLEEHLQYWLRVMQNVAERRQSDRGSTTSTVSTTGDDEGESRRYWNDMVHMPESSSSTADKGKDRADGEPSSSTPVTEFEYGLRPRANTDGPSGPPRINPLANNNWSFDPVPVQPTVPPTQHFTPDFIQPLYGDSAERLDGVPVRGQSPPYQAGTTEPREGDLRLEGEQRRKSMSSAASSRRSSIAGASSSNNKIGMTNIAEEAGKAQGQSTNTHDSSSTDASASVPAATPPSSSGSGQDGGPAPVLQGGSGTGHWAEPMQAPMADNNDGEGDVTDFENMPGLVEREDQAPAAEGPAAEPANAAADPAAAPNANAAAPAAAAAQQAPDSILGEVANFMWRDLDDIDPADLPPIPDNEDEDHADDLFNEDDAPLPLDEQDREAFEAAAAAAAAANLEAEAIEDAEDLDGVMELLGMRGPIAGLFQNAIFCGFLVTVSLLAGIFTPYNIGRVSIWLVANPMRPIMMLFSLSKLLQDIAMSVLGGAAYLTLFVLDQTARAVELAFGVALPYAKNLQPHLATTWDLFTTSAIWVVDNVSIDPPFLSTAEIRNFSAISHEALITIKSNIGAVATGLGRGIAMITTGEFLSHGSDALEFVKTNGSAAWELLRSLPAVLSNPGSWVITLDSMDPVQVSPELAYWGGIDRSFAILFGYATLCLMAGLYLHRGSPISSNATVQEWEASLIDGLNQASGVLKVILIIGIEMLVFPLYCGLLLDIALLPLFENATLLSRLHFSIDYPLTSIFVHWFVGTGYMFHFALFVSMCRKIMRKGVLYFIRDPDDPEFHPVRDVLERSVTTQLRKILFSAFVYGALVIICLGGVVWGLAYAGPEILPIHYSSNEPVLEFPIDLLFYNFLMPLAIKFFKPSDGLHSMYTWWFRKSARGLRITWFLFGERRIDEEGALALEQSSPHKTSPWLVRQFLEYDEDSEKVVPVALMKSSNKNSKKVYEEVDYNTNVPASILPPHGGLIRRRKPDGKSMLQLGHKKQVLVTSGQLVPNGKFVRAPASDQVKIPKNKDVFLEVADGPTLRRELGYPPKRIALAGPSSPRLAAIAAATAAAAAEAEEPSPPRDIYHGKQYELVYIPPFFRVRIFFFIASIWMFAAVTGVSFTIIPLLFGRRLFRLLLPADVRTNDIYAFSIGIYVLGSASYFVFHARSILGKMWAATKRTLSATNVRSAVGATLNAVKRVTKLVYAYFFILVVFPLLATALVELYVLIPLHTYMYPPGSALTTNGSESRHTVRIIQSWTLGLLYLKVSARTITSWYPEARLTSAIRAVLRRGNLDPDVRLLTRAFVVPGLVLGLAAIGLPMLLAKGYVAAATSLEIANVASPALLQFFLPAAVPAPTVADMRLVYRLSFPFVALVGFGAWSLWGMAGVYASWKLRIRDEAYLIGERLHNFGATSAQTAARRAPARAAA